MSSKQEDLDTAAKLRAQGIDVDTVQDFFEEQRADSGISRFNAPRLEGCSPLPEPGIYFGMSDEEYHALPALSNTGLKKLAASPMIFWASTPWLCERKRKQQEEAEEKAHHIFGKAYHARLLEGVSVFASRYAVHLDPADYPDCLVHTDEIKAAIGKFTETVPVTPRGNKEELVAQLHGCQMRAGHAKLDCTGMKIDDLKAAIRGFTETVPVKPVQKVTDPDGPGGEPYERAAVKADWIAQLMALDPDAKIFANLQAQHGRDHSGKTFLYPDQFEELEIAATMIERDPELKDAFRDGYAEVVLIWYCDRTGAPMKAKLDYIKLEEIVDLKSVSNQRDRSIEQAIRFEISSYHYNFQPVVYFEGARVVRKLLRDGHGVVSISQDDPDRVNKMAWVNKWAKNKAPDEFLWVFQQKGQAPITRGVRFPRTGITHEDTEHIIERGKRRFIQFSEVFGTDPWLDVAPIYTINDEDIPRQATEI